MCLKQEEVNFDFGIDCDCKTNTEFMKDTTSMHLFWVKKHKLRNNKKDSDLNALQKNKVTAYDPDTLTGIRNSLQQVLITQR